MPIQTLRGARPAAPFWLLCGLLIIIFLTGGSQRADVQSLQFLRPSAILMAAYGLFTLRGNHWWRYRHLFYLMGAVLALVVVHLIPLPSARWQDLPGRDILRDIDALSGLRDQWRPLSMVPERTTNALYSLAVPVAVLSLGVQLEDRDHARLLMLLIILSTVSGAFGLLQAIGIDIQPYALSSDNAGLFANRNHQGVLLALLFPMLAVAASLGSVVILRDRLMTILALALAVIAVPLIVITGSRAGLLAAVLAIVLVPVIKLGQGRFPRSRSKHRWLSLAKSAAALATVSVLIWLTIFASRQTALTRLEASEGDVRYPVWASIIDKLPVYMPWGSGVGSYADVYQIFEPAELLRPTFSNHAHNEWLEIAMTAGLPGIAIMAWAIGLFVFAAWQAFRTSARECEFARLGLAIILVLAFASTFDYPVRTPIMSSVLMIAAVWASSFKGFEKEDERR